MEQPTKTDYVAALRQYRQYGKGRSMRKFCEDEGYDYSKFCRYSREGDKLSDVLSEKGSEAGSAGGTFIPLTVENDGNGKRMEVLEVRIRFSTGLELVQQGGDVEGLFEVMRKIQV